MEFVLGLLHLHSMRFEVFTWADFVPWTECYHHMWPERPNVDLDPDVPIKVCSDFGVYLQHSCCFSFIWQVSSSCTPNLLFKVKQCRVSGDNWGMCFNTALFLWTKTTVGHSLILLWTLLPSSEVILSLILTEPEHTTARVFPVTGFILIVIHMKINCDHLWWATDQWQNNMTSSIYDCSVLTELTVTFLKLDCLKKITWLCLPVKIVLICYAWCT